jgi:hypothetical protein
LAVNAMLVIPGVAPIRGNGRAWLSGETFPGYHVAGNADRVRHLVVIFFIFDHSFCVVQAALTKSE